MDEIQSNQFGRAQSNLNKSGIAAPAIANLLAQIFWNRSARMATTAATIKTASIGYNSNSE